MPAAHAERGIEWLCLRECLQFSRRHPRYFLIFLMLYWHSIWNWRQARAARYGFCFLQLYDDLMDGDRRTKAGPDEIAAQTIAEWNRGQFAGRTPLSRFGEALQAAFQSLPLRTEDDPNRDVLILLQAMRKDAHRVAEGILLTRSELKTHLHTTFHHSINLLLMAARTRSRADQIPDLVAALAWCSVVRDFPEDLGKGLVNIPAEVAEQAGDFSLKSPEVQVWLEEERLAALGHLQASKAALAILAHRDARAGRLLGLFQRSIERYAKRNRLRRWERPRSTLDEGKGVHREDPA